MGRNEYLLAAVICAVVLATSSVVAWAQSQQHPTARIELPRSNDQVGEEIRARGTVSYLQPGTHLWLVVRRGPLMWQRDPRK